MKLLRLILNLQFSIFKRLGITKLKIRKLAAIRRGYSLVELVVATAIISILTILIMSFLVDKFVENAQVNARANLQLQTQLTLDLLNRDLKHSANVDSQNRWADNYSPTSPGNNFGWVSDSSTLILAIPAQDASGSIIYEDPHVYISYKDNLVWFLEGSTFYKRILAADTPGNDATTTCPAGAEPSCPADVKLADNVVSVNFSYFDANDNEVSATDARSMSVTMVVRNRVFGRDIEVSETIRTVFRNE